MKPQLVLMRILPRATTPTARTTSPIPRDPVHHTGTAQWDENHPFHLGVLESQGILQTYMLETLDGGAKACLYPCVAFQLHLLFGGNEQLQSGNKCGETTKRDWNEVFYNGLKPIKQPWGSFDFIPKRQGEIIFFQAESSRILFAQLPGGSPRRLICSDEEDVAATQINEDRTKVYCVGRHSSTILSIAIRPDGLALASAGRDGCIRVWRLSDGNMIAQTMFARWRQPRSPGIGRVSPLRRQNDEIDCAYPALRVLSFFGKSWDVAMGCPSGEARTWTQEVDECSPLTIKRIAESATLFSGKSPISSLALHVPDSNFPLQQQDHDDAEDEEYYAATLAMNFQERIAVGTSHGKLIVWTRHKNLGDWSPTWSTTPSSEGASIVCLSFRADGGLLAAAASFSAKQLTDEETEALLLASPPKKIKRVCERVYLYESLSWGCVGSLNFSSQIGSCLFYRPSFRAEDKQDPRRCVTREKVSSCRVLLVATASGPQAHILPEHGLFGYRDGRCAYPRPQRPPAFRKEAKTVRWADLKREQREGGGELESPSCPGDRPVRSAPAGSSTYCTHAAHRCERERSRRPVTADDLLWTPNSPMGRSEARRNAAAPSVAAATAARSPSRSPPLRSRSPAGCVHAVKGPTFRDPYQDPSLPAEPVGFPMEVAMKYRDSTRQWPPRLKTRKCVCCSKHTRSKELPVPYPMGKVVIQNLRSVAAKKSPSASARPSPRRRAAPLQPGRKHPASCASLADLSPTPSHSATRRFKRKPMTILSMRFDDGPDDDDQTPRHEDDPFSECESQLYDEDFASSFQHQQSHTAPDDPTLSPAADVRGTGEEETENEVEEEEVHEGAPLDSGAASHPQTAAQQQKHRRPQPVIGGERLYTTVVNQHLNRGIENIHRPVQLSSDSPEHHHIGATPQYSNDEDNPVQSQQLFMNRPDFVGGDNLPDKHIVGGNELEDFLEKERSPLKVMAPAVREMAEERKLVQPEPFSTAKLLERLHEVERETFSMEAALRVAKLRGIKLDEEDEKELRRVLEKESTQTTVTKLKGPEVKSEKPPMRYSQLKKIDDPRVSHPGPFLAARKVRKQIDPKWEDMRTMKPTLSDLWDLKERCAQVCSPSPADIDHNVSYFRGDRNAEDSELSAQREATCRHAWSSQAIYDGCLYKPDQRDPNCGCSTRVQIRR